MKDPGFAKLVVFVNALVPLGLLAADGVQGRLGANPVEFFLRTTGLLALIFLLISLTVTPARKITGWNWLSHFRRMLGLFAFFYALMHLGTYFIFDKSLNVGAVIADTVKRPFITLGMAAFVIMIPLAITSTNGMVKRLGAARWKNLHKLVYFAAIAAVVHFWMFAKADKTQPIGFAIVLGVLFMYRIIANRISQSKVRKLSAAAALIGLIFGVGATVQAQEGPVVVQLFTSEGCSSCPPADVIMSEMADGKSPVEGVTIIPMSLHVDYWDRLGWRDPYSSKQFSDYQASYGRQTYTPQMIMDGASEAVGNDRPVIGVALQTAAGNYKPNVVLKVGEDLKNDQMLNLSIDIQQRDVLPEDATKYNLMIAVTEDNLSNDVQRGENAGKKLDHDAVVRLLQIAGEFKVSDPAKPIAKSIQLDPSWKRKDLHVIVYLQSQTDQRIRGAATARLPDSMLQAAGG